MGYLSPLFATLRELAVEIGPGPFGGLRHDGGRKYQVAKAATGGNRTRTLRGIATTFWLGHLRVSSSVVWKSDQDPSGDCDTRREIRPLPY